MKGEQILNLGVKQAVIELKKAKAKKVFYKFLLASDLRESDAFRYAHYLDFKMILSSKEFNDEEKQQVREIMKPIEKFL